MADLARIKRNVAKMAAQNAPVEDIDGYIASEGVTVEDVRNFRPDAVNGHSNVPQYVPPGVEGYNPQTGEVEPQAERQEGGGLWDRAGAFATGAADVPIAGPALKATIAGLSAGIAKVAGDERPLADIYSSMRGRQEQVMEENPGTALAGQLAGGIAATAPLAATRLGAQALGITGKNLGTRMLASGASSAGISGADTVARGGDGEDIIKNTVIGGGIGLGIPALGQAIQSGVRYAGDRIAPVVNAIRNPAREGSRRVGAAIGRDLTHNPGSVLSSADEAMARQANIPVLNADRGGETTRALARSTANQSPEARAIIEKTASDRFAGQGQRATDFIRRITGGNADDLRYQEILRETARHANKPAYSRAYASPAAQSMWNEGFEQLMQAPAMQTAARQATGRGANRAAAEGFTPIRNPFTVDASGRMTLARQADGSTARPTLQFWDQVKRNLDGMIGKAERAGDRTYAGDLKALKSHLVGMLDDAVPDYRAARQGAAAFFGAEDALEAGRRFANSPRSIPEARQAYSRFSPGEKHGFMTGYASELIDRIKATGDRTNVINSVFKSPAARESMEMVFGPQRMKEIEAYVRVEDIVDRLRGAMGNSTTARQLVELGIGAGGGAYMTGDWTGALGGAMAARGARAAGKWADQRAMQQVARLLTRDDPKAIESAVKLAARTPVYMEAMETLGNLLAVPARVGAVVGNQ